MCVGGRRCAAAGACGGFFLLRRGVIFPIREKILAFLSPLKKIPFFSRVFINKTRRISRDALKVGAASRRSLTMVSKLRAIDLVKSYEQNKV